LSHASGPTGFATGGGVEKSGPLVCGTSGFATLSVDNETFQTECANALLLALQQTSYVSSVQEYDARHDHKEKAKKQKKTDAKTKKADAKAKKAEAKAKKAEAHAKKDDAKAKKDNARANAKSKATKKSPPPAEADIDPEELQPRDLFDDFNAAADPDPVDDSVGQNAKKQDALVLLSQF
jgi:sRNA-binding protein